MQRGGVFYFENEVNAMKRIIMTSCLKTITISFLLILFSATLGLCKEYVVDWDGMDWNKSSKIGKINIIAGIFIGQSCSSLDDVDYSSYKFRAAENTIVRDYVQELDLFYEKPAYRKIKIIDAYVLAVIKFQDNDSNDYKYILKMMLEEKRLPYYGYIKRIIDGNSIVIEDSDPEVNTLWTVRLIGIDAPEIDFQSQTDKEKYGMKAKKFLMAKCLNLTLPCKLKFTEDIFDKHGRLLATCTADYDLSQLLLIHGLAKPYFYKDPKRNYENADTIDRMGLSYYFISEIAKEKKLYIWGGNTDPEVEKLVSDVKIP